MCGIVGMSFRYRDQATPRKDLDLKDLRTMFTEMLVNAQTRGSSATGVMISYFNRAENKNKTAVIRAPLPAKEFVLSKEYKALIEKLDNDAYFVVGHTRAVTNGDARQNKNNHPHRAGHVLGVHNGNINNFRQLWNECPTDMSPSGTCDSEAIFALIEKHRREGVDMHTAIARAAEIMRGWWAIALMDIREPSKMVFAKDKSTPLELAWIPMQRVAVIASELPHIFSAAAKAYIQRGQISVLETKPSTVYSIDSLYSPDVGELYLNSTSLTDSPEYKRTAEEEKIFQTTMGN